MEYLKIQKILELAEKNFRNKQYTDAEKNLNKVLYSQPRNSKANELLSYIHGNRGDQNLAMIYLEKATKEIDCSAEAHYYYGKILLSKSLYKDAIDSLKIAINKAGYFFEALHELGTAYAFIEEHSTALDCYQKCYVLKKDSPQLNYNLAKIHEKLNQYTEAIKFYDDAIKLDSHYVDAWINKGNLLEELGEYQDAINHFDVAIGIKPHYQIYFNKANVLFKLNLYEDAIKCYRQALEVKPNYLEAWTNKGLALQRSGCDTDALSCYEMAITLDNSSIEPLLNQAYLNVKLRNFENAIITFKKILSINKNENWVYGDLFHTELKICSWSEYKNKIIFIKKKENIELKKINPFNLLGLTDQQNLIKKNTELLIEEKFPSKNLQFPFLKNNNKNKIRIGYYSSDLYSHAVGYLVAEMFELHNKDKFEIVDFSFKPIKNDSVRERLKKSFDQFIEVINVSDKEIAKLSRTLDINISVDLMGHTGEARTGIFAYRAAPIQVNYLGYPGTMGASYMDYIIADPVLIPPEFQEFYTEKVVYLPHSYQANDRKREISDRKFSRAEVGLPEKGFVFCCFNNNYKILPETFDIWMRLLHTVDQSVLWLLEDNPTAAKNLRMEAGQRGIDPSRLVFAQRLPSAEHLARHALADLFIDTFPYNAHTTASDALWAGLPLITLQGESFASRVASSLLSAVGLPELITQTPEEYEALAIALAMDPQKLAFIKQKLVKNRLTTPLFDTPLFTKNLEAAYLKMYERYEDNLAPEHIYVNRDKSKL